MRDVEQDPDPDDPLLTVAEVAGRLGIAASNFRAQVARNVAPAADDPDEGRPPSRRRPLWRASRIDAWDAVRRSPGRPRRLPGTGG